MQSDDPSSEQQKENKNKCPPIPDNIESGLIFQS